MIYCSKATELFYDSNLGGEIPDDAVEISFELHAELISAQSQFMKINFETVPPSLIERPPISIEQAAELERSWRDGQLSRTDGVVSRQRDELEAGIPTTFTVEQYAELQLFRHQLRNWPQEAFFPFQEHRPIAPDWLSEQLQ
ncbi:phage tail protein [Pseudomonas sp. MWU318]|uniref:phage tail protein n=1 Tax=Pseudomonas sp. MWU318 TaxID=2802569 RepID=UPI0019288226|nr:phage tail protein [Pseudomonas sp. MWU318]